MTEYHRDAKRFVAENCRDCATDCDGGLVYLGIELRDSGEKPDADPTKFYFIDRCPARTTKEADP